MGNAHDQPVGNSVVRLDRVTRTALIDGAPVEMSDRTFDLFRALVESAPATVSRRDLADAVWPGEVVSDERLSQRVSLLRKALRDAGPANVQVLNDRGRGYSIAGARTEYVETRASHPVPAANHQDRQELSRTSRSMLAVVPILALVIVIWMFVREDDGPPVLVDPSSGDILISSPDQPVLEDPGIAEVEGRKVLIETLFSDEEIAAIPEAQDVVCKLAEDRSQFSLPPDPRLAARLEDYAQSFECGLANSAASWQS